MHVAALWRYPVKSMAGERLHETNLDTLGVPGDRDLYVLDPRGRVVTARNRPRLLTHRAARTDDGRTLVDGFDWTDLEVTRRVEAAAGPGARLVRAQGAERFDILPLLIVSDGALAALGTDVRRLRRVPLSVPGRSRSKAVPMLGSFVVHGMLLHEGYARGLLGVIVARVYRAPRTV